MTIERPCDFWAAQLEAARQLDDNELARHAAVSRNNAHRCVDCFTCACLTVQEERYKR